MLDLERIDHTDRISENIERIGRINPAVRIDVRPRKSIRRKLGKSDAVIENGQRIHGIYRRIAVNITVLQPIGSIADTRTMGRISAKTLFWFLLCSFLALLLAGVVGYTTYSMGLFNTHIEGLTEATGSTGSNPLNVVLNIIPSNIITAFGSNGAVLSAVFLAVAIGLSMNVLGESRTATLRRLMGEVNDVVVVFLNFVVTRFAPFAVFVLLTRTFAIYGVDYLKPALVYVVTTVVLLFVFLLVAYPLVVMLGAKQNPITFKKKIANVAVFGFSTSSSEIGRAHV